MRDLKSIGMWNPEVAINVFQSSAINMTPDEVNADQMIQLYVQLYPYIASEFVYRSDLEFWAEQMTLQFDTKLTEFNTKLATQIDLIEKHTHTAPTGPTGTMDAAAKPTKLTAPSLEKWKSAPEDKEFKEGENLITKNSTYSASFLHRNPFIKPLHFTPKYDIVTIFKAAKKLVPFTV